MARKITKVTWVSDMGNDFLLKSAAISDDLFESADDDFRNLSTREKLVDFLEERRDMISDFYDARDEEVLEDD